ncbi:MAG: SDR family oxidoreductase, partial [Terriglobales bacterium]
MESENHNPGAGHEVYWRVEGSLLELTTVRPIGFFTWNAQTFSERWMRRGLVLLMAALRPLLYASNRVFATRVVHTVLRGVSRDRLELLGEEYFKYALKPSLKAEGVQRLNHLLRTGADVVLVSQGLDVVMRPLAAYLGVNRLIANRMEYRDGIATGRLLDPVIRPRGVFARITGTGSDGKREPEQLVSDLGLSSAAVLNSAVISAARPAIKLDRPIVRFSGETSNGSFSIRRALAGKNVMLIGVTGFIGKVWLANTLMDLPEIGKIYLLIRRQKSNPAQSRFEKLVEESPVFDSLARRHGADLGRFISEHVEIVEGDVSQPGIGIAPEMAKTLGQNLDVVINSSGLTDFNPDLRDALATNVDGALNVLEFVRGSSHAGLLHLSTCYVAGTRDGRVGEMLRPHYTPIDLKGFDVEQ